MFWLCIGAAPSRSLQYIQHAGENSNPPTSSGREGAFTSPFALSPSMLQREFLLYVCLVCQRGASFLRDASRNPYLQYTHFPVCGTLSSDAKTLPSPADRCPRCYECPCCGSVLAPSRVSLEEALAPSSSRDAGRSFCLQCLYCQWTSEESGVVAPDPASLAEAAAAAAAREKESCGGGGSAAGIDALLKAARQREAVAASARGGGGGAARLRAGSGGGGGVAGTAGGTTSTSLFSTASGAGASATGPWKVCARWRGKRRRAQPRRSMDPAHASLPPDVQMFLRCARVRRGGGSKQCFFFMRTSRISDC